MKIHGIDPLQQLKELLHRTGEGEKTGETRPSHSAAQSAPHDAAGSDRVQFSPEAREITELRAVLLDTPEIRRELVERLKNEIASGRYRVDGTRVAEGLLSERFSLVTGGKGGSDDA